MKGLHKRKPDWWGLLQQRTQLVWAGTWDPLELFCNRLSTWIIHKIDFIFQGKKCQEIEIWGQNHEIMSKLGQIWEIGPTRVCWVGLICWSDWPNITRVSHPLHSTKHCMGKEEKKSIRTLIFTDWFLPFQHVLNEKDRWKISSYPSLSYLTDRRVG